MSFLESYGKMINAGNLPQSANISLRMRNFDNRMGSAVSNTDTEGWLAEETEGVDRFEDFPRKYKSLFSKGIAIGEGERLLSK